MNASSTAMWHSCSTFISKGSQAIRGSCFSCPGMACFFHCNLKASMLCVISEWLTHVALKQRELWQLWSAGAARKDNWHTGSYNCSVGNTVFFTSFLEHRSGTEDSCSCRSPKGLQNNHMLFPQSVGFWDLSVMVWDSSCRQKQRWSCGEVTWQRQWGRFPASLQTLCDLISTGPSCAFSLSPELTAVSVHAWHANSAEIKSTGRKTEGAKLHFH